MFVIAFETYDDTDAYGYPVEKYLKGISVRENGKFYPEMTEQPDAAARFNELVNLDAKDNNNIFNLCKKHFGVLQPKIKKLNITVE